MKQIIKSISLIQPDDWHLHLRDGSLLQSVLPVTAQYFARALIMPNLIPPIVTSADAQAYLDKILCAIPEGSNFEPRLTLYLTEETDPEDLTSAYESGLITAAKAYPAGATTNSSSGVRDFNKICGVLERMAKIGCPLCVHGEVTDPNVDIFDREAVFIDRILAPMQKLIPGLRVVMEHITTKEGVDYVLSNEKDLVATITIHHLLINRNNMLSGGIKPHYYCLPVAKREEHRIALCTAATGGDHRFFLGTDSAPHVETNKLSCCGCAGIFNSPVAVELITELFEENNSLDKLESFMSTNGCDCYNLPYNEEKIEMQKSSWDVPEKYDNIGPMYAGKNLKWKII